MKPKTYIEVLLKRKYGNERFYPISEDAKVLCALLKSVTLTKKKLKIMKDSGWEVVIKMEEYNLDE